VVDILTGSTATVAAFLEAEGDLEEGRDGRYLCRNQGSRRLLFEEASELVSSKKEPIRSNTPGGPGSVVDFHTGRDYLKDWHFRRDGGGNWYAPPPGLDDDWLNRHCDRRGADDFRFCYLGGAGSRTPLHADVLASHSWSCNVSGAKDWWLFPPSETGKLRDADGGLADDVRPGRRGLRKIHTALFGATAPGRLTALVEER